MADTDELVDQALQEASGPSSGLKQRNVTITFIVLGTVVILPWNCILSASEFLDNDAFPNQNWPTFSTQVYQTVFLITQVLMIMWGSRIGPVMQFLAPLAGGIFSTIFLMIAALGHGGVDGRFALGLVACAFLGASMGVMQAALFGVAAQGIKHFGNLPGQIMVGMGVAGVAAFSISLLGQYGIGKTAEASFKLLFAAVIAASVLCVFLFKAFRSIGELNARELLKAGSDSQTLETGVAEATDDVEVWSASRSVYAGLTYELAVCSVFLVTFMVFPAQCSKWTGTGPIAASNYLTFVFGNFQVMDTVGRWSAENVRFFHRFGTPVPLWTLAILRVVFVPLFFLSANSTNGLLSLQGFQLPLMALFAVSNGLVSSLAMQFAPQHVPAPARGTVGMAMTLSLVGGIAMGSWLTLAFNA